MTYSAQDKADGLMQGQMADEGKANWMLVMQWKW